MTYCRRRILVVDDDPQAASLLGRPFSVEGECTVTLARDGKAALEALTVPPPFNLVLLAPAPLDLLRLEVAARAIEQEIPLLVNCSDPDAAAAVAELGLGLLTKPFELQDLDAGPRLNQLLAEVRANISRLKDTHAIARSLLARSRALQESWPFTPMRPERDDTPVPLPRGGGGQRGPLKSSALDIQVGARMRRRRVALGKSPGQLARATGLTVRQIAAHESGAMRVGATRLWAVAQALDVPIGYFFEVEAPLPSPSDATPDASSRRARSAEHRPGEAAPRSGLYQEVNVFGSPTGQAVRIAQREHLPPGPRGFGWRVMAGTAADTASPDCVFTAAEKEIVATWSESILQYELEVYYDDSYQFIQEALCVCRSPADDLRWLVHKTPDGDIAVRQWPGLAEIMATLPEALRFISATEAGAYAGARDPGSTAA
jgi:transcriptional regulator with XRE-family HTH domain